jgi:hypothetical protein
LQFKDFLLLILQLRLPPFSFLAAVLIPSAAKIRQVERENFNAFNHKQLLISKGDKNRL